MANNQNPYGVAPNTSVENPHTAQVTEYPPEKSNGFAITALVLGILSFFFYFFTAIPGIIFGHIALSRIKRSPAEYDGKGMAIAGLIFSYIMFLLSLVIVGFFVYLIMYEPGFQDELSEAFKEGMQQNPYNVNQ